MDNNKFLGESGLNQLITNVHDVTFKEISYADYMALPEEERKIGRYAVPDWPEESGVVGNYVVSYTTLMGEKKLADNDDIYELSDSMLNYDSIVFVTSYNELSDGNYMCHRYATTYTKNIIAKSISEYDSTNKYTGSVDIGTIANDQYLMTWLLRVMDTTHIEVQSKYSRGWSKKQCYIEEIYGIKYNSINSKKSSQHNYSTEEQVVGTWIDGKPLYERTFLGKTNTSSSDNLIILDPNIDIVKFDAYMIDSADNKIPSGFFDGTNRFNVYYYKNNHSINNVVNSDWGRNRDIIVYAQYTKTTD